jgi:hypothetical protein
MGMYDDRLPRRADSLHANSRAPDPWVYSRAAVRQAGLGWGCAALSDCWILDAAMTTPAQYKYKTPDNLWIPRADWRRTGQDTAPYIRASWVSDAWSNSEHYVKAERAEKAERMEQLLTKQLDNVRENSRKYEDRYFATCERVAKAEAEGDRLRGQVITLMKSLTEVEAELEAERLRRHAAEQAQAHAEAARGSLLMLIDQHNKECDQVCANTLHCHDGHKRRCSTCPKDWRIEL